MDQQIYTVLYEILRVLKEIQETLEEMNGENDD